MGDATLQPSTTERDPLDYAESLYRTIHRGSCLEAGALGLTLTADELRQLRERIVLGWFMEKLTEHEAFTVGDYLEKVGG